MATKKTNISEIEQQYLEAKKNFELLHKQFEAAKKEEEEAKKAKLAAEKQKRYDAVVDAYDKFEKLRTNFVNDYGSFTFKTKSADEKVCDWILEALGLI